MIVVLSCNVYCRFSLIIQKRSTLVKIWFRRVLLPLSFENAYECRSSKRPLEDDIGGEFGRADRLIAGYLFFTPLPAPQPRTLDCLHLAAAFRRP